MGMVDEQVLAPGFFGHLQQMMETHPTAAFVPSEILLGCLQACLDCAQTCISCADACLAESEPRALVRCIRLNQDCANLCEVTGKMLSRQTFLHPEISRAVVEACRVACAACAVECDRHARHMEHCRVCAETCRRCERACERFLAAT